MAQPMDEGRQRRNRGGRRHDGCEHQRHPPEAARSEVRGRERSQHEDGRQQ